MVVFKIVRVEETNRRSYSQTRHGCDYHQAIKTAPSFAGSKLFAFDTLEHAHTFFKLVDIETGEFEIWRCEAEGAEPIAYEAYLASELEGFWDGSLPVTKYIDTAPGTLGCASITLQECVHTNLRPLR